jgi:hypothetical protein
LCSNKHVSVTPSGDLHNSMISIRWRILICSMHGSWTKLVLGLSSVVYESSSDFSGGCDFHECIGIMNLILFSFSSFEGQFVMSETCETIVQIEWSLQCSWTLQLVEFQKMHRLITFSFRLSISTSQENVRIYRTQLNYLNVNNIHGRSSRHMIVSLLFTALRQITAILRSMALFKCAVDLKRLSLGKLIVTRHCR